MSIRLRLTLWYSGLFAVAFIAIGFVIYNTVYHNSISEIKDRLIKVSNNIEASVSRFPNEINLNSSAPGFDASIIGMQFVDYSKARIGYTAGKSNNLVRSNVTFPFPAQDEAEVRFVLKQVDNLPFYIYELPVKIKGTETVVGLLQVGALIGTENKFFSQLRTILWFSGAAGVISAFLLGMFLSRKALRPIERVTEAAERIQSGSELGLRIPRESANDEIGRLTDTLNGMLTRLERAYKTLEDSNAAQRRFVSDASHELRTPLTTIRGNVDLLEKIWGDEKDGGESRASSESAVMSLEERRQYSLESIRDIADEARRMSRLVNDLLALARADTGYVVEMERLSLKALAEEAARRASFLPRQAEWVVGPLSALDGVWVKGNRDYLLQLLFILIENGFKYTPAGEVRLYASYSGQHIGLTVADTGIGLNQEEIPHIFERFYRADVSRGETSGTGLGLSIAKWIADMHYARIEVRSRPGEGTAFTVWLPVLHAEAGGVIE